MHYKRTKTISKIMSEAAYAINTMPALVGFFNVLYTRVRYYSPTLVI